MRLCAGGAPLVQTGFLLHFLNHEVLEHFVNNASCFGVDAFDRPGAPMGSLGENYAVASDFHS